MFFFQKRLIRFISDVKINGFYRLLLASVSVTEFYPTMCNHMVSVTYGKHMVSVTYGKHIMVNVTEPFSHL